MGSLDLESIKAKRDSLNGNKPILAFTGLDLLGQVAW